MQKIIPHLWFDTQAKEAAAFYASVFPDASITRSTTIHNTPSGDCDIVSFEISGYSFMAISAGPYFKPTPAISFMLNFDPSDRPQAAEELQALWDVLSKDGTVLMPLGEYPFSKKYGWISDKYGVSWQLILTDPSGDKRPFVVPSLLFVGDVCGKAQEASDFYLSVFKNSQRGITARYLAGAEPEKEGNVMFTDFSLEGQWFAAMDSAQDHRFSFTEGVSLIVNCENQEELDYFYEKLSAVPESEQCGWVKDKYGVSWQITPAHMHELLADPDAHKAQRVTDAMLKMKRIDIASLEAAAQE